MLFIAFELKSYLIIYSISLRLSCLPKGACTCLHQHDAAQRCPFQWTHGHRSGLHLAQVSTLFCTSLFIHIIFADTSLRGSPQQRQPRFRDVYYPFESAGFSMFEFLSLVDVPGVTVMLGINAAAETASSVAGLVEYLWGPSSSTYGALRARDGRELPYPPATIEIGWLAANLTETYVRQFSVLTEAMSAAIKIVAPSFAPLVRFAVASPPDASLFASPVQHLITFCSTLGTCVWSQAVALSTSAALEAWEMSVLAPLVQSLSQAGIPWYVGETRCLVASQELARSQNRAVLNAFANNVAMRRNALSIFHATWSSHMCGTDTCDGTGTSPIQQQLDVTAGSVVAQPPWHAAALYRTLHGGAPAFVTPRMVSGLPGMMDVAATVHVDTPLCTGLCQCTLVLAIAHDGAVAQPIAVEIDGASMPSSFTASVMSLACPDDALNTQATPNACVPHAGSAPTVQGQTVLLMVPPTSVTTVLVPQLICVV
jgi:hypothetical protein